jgi:hypothetical protein
MVALNSQHAPATLIALSSRRLNVVARLRGILGPAVATAIFLRAGAGFLTASSRMHITHSSKWSRIDCLPRVLTAR